MNLIGFMFAQIITGFLWFGIWTYYMNFSKKVADVYMGKPEELLREDKSESIESEHKADSE